MWVRSWIANFSGVGKRFLQNEQLCSTLPPTDADAGFAVAALPTPTPAAVAWSAWTSASSSSSHVTLSGPSTERTIQVTPSASAEVSPICSATKLAEAATAVTPATVPRWLPAVPGGVGLAAAIASAWSCLFRFLLAAPALAANEAAWPAPHVWGCASGATP